MDPTQPPFNPLVGLDVVRRTEAEPSLLGASAHLLAVARKRHLAGKEGA